MIPLEHKEKLKRQAIRLGNIDYYPANDVDNVLEKLQKQGIYWCEEDFKGLAINKYGDDWDKFYDESKFEEALENMVRHHDCQYGITWDTVKYYLDEFCKKQSFTKIYKDI